MFQVSISGSAGSSKILHKALRAFAKAAQEADARGTFSFTGSVAGGGGDDEEPVDGRTISVIAAPADDALAMADEAIEAYNASADADDQVS